MCLIRLLLVITGISSTVLAGCAVGGRSDSTLAEPPRVTGRLAYVARIALPPDAVAVIAVHDLSVAGRPLVAETQLALHGRQVPLPFSVILQPGVTGRRLELDAAIRVGGQPRWIVTGVPIVFSGAIGDVGELRLTPYQPLAFEARFDCGGRLVRFGMQGDVPTLVIGDERVGLKPVPAASGARYQADASPSTEFWSRDGEATLTLRGERMPTCRLLR